jgi:hypothetical protein
MIAGVAVDGMTPVRFDGSITIEGSDTGTVRITIAQPGEIPLGARREHLLDAWVHWVSLPAAFAFAFLRALRP